MNQQQPPQPTKKSSATAWIILIVIVIILGVGAYFYFVQTEEEGNVNLNTVVNIVPDYDSKTVQIVTDKINYNIGDDIKIRIVNNLDSDIWIRTSCEEPFWFTRWDGANWIPFGYHGLRECRVGTARLNKNKESTSTIEKKDNTFIGEGFYKIQVNYTDREPRNGENYVYSTAYSNMFSVGESKKESIDEVGRICCIKGCSFESGDISFMLADAMGDPEKDFINKGSLINIKGLCMRARVKGKIWEELFVCPEEGSCAMLSGIKKYIDMSFIERLYSAELGEECSYDLQCENIDCSSYDNQVIEGYEPFCVDNECKCKCYGCE